LFKADVLSLDEEPKGEGAASRLSCTKQLLKRLFLRPQKCAHMSFDSFEQKTKYDERGWYKEPVDYTKKTFSHTDLDSRLVCLEG
jgi:hypothetical protein